MIEYLLDVRPILDEVGADITLSGTLELDDLVVGDETFVPIAPVRFNVSVGNAGEALVAVGSITAPVSATCSRCLCDFETAITGDVEGYWPRPGEDVHEDQDISGEVDSGGSIDLGPVLMAALVVEAPFAPLHAEECAGLCATCGADLNEGPCSCADGGVASDHPFAALKELVGDDEGRTE